jgi:hypothetical protein
MSAIEPRDSNAHLRRLQVLLVLMLLWDLLALFAALSFGSALMKIDGDEISGFLGAKVSLSGAALVPVAIYFYGLVRSPVRHPGVIWVGVIEQAAVVLFGLYHLGTGDLAVQGAVLPIVVSLVLLVLLLANMVRGDARV